MGKGIAAEFQERYGIRDDLLKLDNLSIGDCALFVCPDRKVNVFNLVTKKEYYSKPTYDTLTESLLRLKNMVKALKIKN